MKTTNLTIRDVHRTSEVDRWQIVRTDQRQSVAEHSYLVAMIAARYCRAVIEYSDLEDKVIRYALYHDLPEVLTGDLVAPVKELVNTEALRRWEERLTFMGDDTQFSPTVRFIVKVADITEAIVWLELHGTNDHARTVQRRLYDKLQHITGEDAPNDLSRIIGGQVDRILDEIVNGPQSFIDDLSEKDLNG